MQNRKKTTELQRHEPGPVGNETEPARAPSTLTFKDPGVMHVNEKRRPWRSGSVCLRDLI